MEMKGNDKRGYSLIELVVSILMFALGFIGVMKMQQQAIMGNGFSMQMGNALSIADTHSEYLRGLILTEPELTLGAHTSGTTSTLQGVTYQLSWIVSTVNTTGFGKPMDARQVDIRVRWTEKGLDHQVSMNMFRST
jgi:Tfp pilus assembly protein PilV